MKICGMKKTMIALVAGAVVAQSASAFDFNWGAWGRAGWAPLVIQGGHDHESEDPTDTATYLGVNSGPGWDSIGAAIGFELNGSNADKTLGFVAKLRLDSGPNIWRANDTTANAWAKPFNMLTVRMGMYQVDDLRGKVGGLNNTMRFGYTGDEDDILMRFDSGQFGAHLKLEPIENLQVHASLGTNGKWAEVPEDNTAITDIYSTGHYGIGYTIPNIGFARFQFIGGTYDKFLIGQTSTKAKLWNQLAFAFQVTAIDNLNVDLGVNVPLQIKGKPASLASNPQDSNTYGGLPIPLMEEDDTYQAPITIALGANYTMGDLGLLGRLRFKVAESGNIYNSTQDIDIKGPFVFGIDVEPSYQIGTLGRVYGDIGFEYSSESEWDGNGRKDDAMRLALGASFFKTIANGSFAIGVCAQLPLGGGYYNEDGREVAKARDLKVAVPMTITYSLY